MPIILDNGTGYTKIGYSGNQAPSYVIPTVYAESVSRAKKGTAAGLDDMDFLIGKDALDNYQNYQPSYPMRHGLIEDWNSMERLWHHCFYKYLRTNPEDHVVMLTEPPLNPPENREFAAEIMFETYGVKGLCIAVQAVLALASAWSDKNYRKINNDNVVLTGTVIDSGDGVTHVIPVAEGYVINSCIKHIPLAGRDITNFIQQMLRDRDEKVPPEDILQLSGRIKEEYCYVCRDLPAEFAKFDTTPEKNILKHQDVYQKTGKSYEIDIGYERFLGPELFFTPEIFSSDFTDPLPNVVDRCIQLSPTDCRRGLYKNIVLSGGSTMFKNFRKRLQIDMEAIVAERVKMYRANVKDVKLLERMKDIEVNVIAPPVQRYAVWYGGSWLAELPSFSEQVKTKADYEEHGPKICRSNAAFASSSKK